MRYILMKDGEEIPVEISGEHGNYNISIGDDSYEVDSHFLLPGLYSLLVNGQSYEATVYSPEAHVYNVHLHDGMRRVELISPIDLVLKTQGGGAGSGDLSVKSPMPGKVVRILVSEGQQVEKGQGVVVVEAMKMQNELQALADGVVKEIKVAEGEGVEGGADLVLLEEA